MIRLGNFVLSSFALVSGIFLSLRDKRILFRRTYYPSYIHKTCAKIYYGSASRDEIKSYRETIYKIVLNDRTVIKTPYYDGPVGMNIIVYYYPELGRYSTKDLFGKSWKSVMGNGLITLGILGIVGSTIGSILGVI